MQPTTELLCPVTPRNGYLLHLFTDPPSCHASDSSIQVRLNDTDSSRVYPCLETKCLACKAKRIELPCLVIRRIGHPQLVCCTSDLRSSISSSSRLRSQLRLTLSRFYPCTDSNCISCAANIRTALRATSRTESRSTLYASVPACIAPGCSPIRLRPQPRPTQPESTLRGCSLQPALPTPRTARPASWQTDTCSTRVHRDSILRSLQPESQQATEPTRATTPECTHAQKPTALHAAPTSRTVLLATSLSMATSWILT